MNAGPARLLQTIQLGADEWAIGLRGSGLALLRNGCGKYCARLSSGWVLIKIGNGDGFTS